MADYFFTDGPAVNSIIIALADAFYEAAVDQQVDAWLGVSRGRRAASRTVRLVVYRPGRVTARSRASSAHLSILMSFSRLD
ncbi:hypothetical protein ACFWWM_23915 [Streptomyces sp. NPDC058682]|uniref:hypothetical protein n=1 Tax=Streptomyces sp. NPDC058682 TaxID=3346596 RepID=UPI00364DC9DF